MLEILKYILPGLIVFAAVYLVLHYHLKQQREKAKVEVMLNNRKTIIPLRLQAYERLILFLERISPEALIMRIQRPNLSVFELQSKLLQTIRTEFDHNLTQQLYVSNDAWKYVRNARENVVKIINSSAEQHDPKKPAMHLSKTILEDSTGSNDPTKKAIHFLKSEGQVILKS
ncbi:MAG TPA: hypothetical protein VJ937_10880 [Salinivirga sp.]|uniref:DUF7935 family protein n=1 Tax=Salinivirga sp. TaxID=1970192 RepID=UPI002B49AA7A|nr:hypothetical protein [Salinivirga sp.]HKK59974.1 hypothetical protein [Salinivirga sp.]